MEEIEILSRENTAEAYRVLKTSGIEKIWRDAGCRVNLVGSLRMGLLMKHRDIDLHVYSRHITIADSFAIASRIASDPNVKELRCINGLHTDEHCIAWHISYISQEGNVWQIDIIHIEEGTHYDGFFERIADRIKEIITPEQRNTILKLKFQTPKDADWHGIEYYEAVIADGVSSLSDLRQWISDHRLKQSYYWKP